MIIKIPETIGIFLILKIISLYSKGGGAQCHLFNEINVNLFNEINVYLFNEINVNLFDIFSQSIKL